MLTLYDRCKTESLRCAINNFLDDFRASPSKEYITDSILDLSNLSSVDKAYIAATVDAVCSEVRVDRPAWVFDKRTYLDTPYFACNAKGALRVVLLSESPRWFRSRNIFVTKNCIERV